MTFPIGSNLQAYSPDLDFYGALGFWKPLNPAVMTVCINNLNDKGRIYDAQDVLRSAVIVARYIVTVKQDNEDVEIDGALHTKPLGKDDTNYWLVSPENYLNLIEPLAAKGAVLYWGNEPSGEVDAVTFDRLVKHTVEGILLADKRGYSLCVLNWGVGHPLLINDDSEIDPRLEPVFMAIANAKHKHYIGLHLYAPADLSKRLFATEGLCKRLNIKMPTVIITEFGFDAANGGDVLNGYQTRMTGRQFAEFTITTVRTLYRPLIEAGKLLGLTVFCEGGSPKWKAFNTTNDKGYKDRITEAVTSGELSMAIKQTGQFPRYFPNIPPGNLEYPYLYKIALPSGIPYRNLRVLPEEASDKTAEAYNGDKVRVWDTPTEYDSLNRKWQYCEVVEGQNAGKKGWLYVVGILTLVPTLPPDTPRTTVEIPVLKPFIEAEPIEPAPADPPAPQPPVGVPVGCPETFNTTLSRDQLVALGKKIRAMEAAFADLAKFVESLVEPVKPEGVPSVQS